MSSELVNIGARIKRARKARKMSQATLAELTKTSISHISDIERGATNCSLSVFLRIVEVLEVSADSLLMVYAPEALKIYSGELSSLLSDCTPAEAAIILNTLKELKSALMTSREKEE